MVYLAAKKNLLSIAPHFGEVGDVVPQPWARIAANDLVDLCHPHAEVFVYLMSG